MGVLPSCVLPVSLLRLAVFMDEWLVIEILGVFLQVDYNGLPFADQGLSESDPSLLPKFSSPRHNLDLAFCCHDFALFFRIIQHPSTTVLTIKMNEQANRDDSKQQPPIP